MTQAKFFEEKEDFEEEEIPKPRKPGEAPDGGWGWVVVIGSFLCNLFIEGLVFSFPYLREEIGEYYDVSLQAAGTVGTLLMGFSLLAGNIVHGDFCKNTKNSDTRKIALIYILKFKQYGFYNTIMHPKGTDGIANSVNPDQTAPLGSMLFVKTCLSED